MTSLVYDYAVIGGGIVGLSTAWQLQQQYPHASVLVIEKEPEFSFHQTGHNSGVVHAGVYYQPGSLKARFCKEGNSETLAFCRQSNIAFEQCGKLLVATDGEEQRRMLELQDRCRQNEIDVELLTAEQLQAREPAITGVGALLVRDTAIVDYRRVSREIAARLRGLGGRLLLEHEVLKLQEKEDCVEIGLQSPEGRKTVQAGFLVACGGLMADRLAKMQGLKVDFQIIPYRGEYYRLAQRHSGLIQHLIYPIPDPALPFLGIHLTRMIDGSITVGPNAVQGWKREGYGRINFSPCDTLEMLRFPGFWKATGKHLGAGLQEMKNSLWKRGYLMQVRKYCPRIKLADLKPYPAGIRAQAVLRDGTLVHDFLLAESRRSLHVCNAPSPAATSAIPIGKHICQIIASSVT